MAPRKGTITSTTHICRLRPMSLGHRCARVFIRLWREAWKKRPYSFFKCRGEEWKAGCSRLQERNCACTGTKCPAIAFLCGDKWFYGQRKLVLQRIVHQRGFIEMKSTARSVWRVEGSKGTQEPLAHCSPDEDENECQAIGRTKPGCVP